MEIQFEDQLPEVENAVQMANELLANPGFYDRIKEHSRFDLASTEATPEKIAELLRDSKLTFKIDLFYPGLFGSLFKYRKTLAYTDERYPNTLFLNVRKLEREPAEIAATIIHEAIHALDDEQVDYTFGHGNNSSRGKENTAPYWIGNLAYAMLMPGAPLTKLEFDQTEEN